LINLKNITKHYGEIKAINRLSHSFKRGQTTVIIGPSGCGKSTLIKLMTGLIKPDSGEITINSSNLAASNLSDYRTKLGYVIQEGGLFPHLNVRNNVTISADYLNWNSEDIKERYMHLVHLTKLSDEYSIKYPHELSGGQRQRVSLMRALMLDPDLLLLDEPLGALDPLIRFDLQKDLKQIFTELRKTVLIVTHDLSEALYFADEIILMNDGSIEQTGARSDLIDHPANSFVKRFVTAQRNRLE
jgi:osmoprotectant transport system ATP-binding protein